MRNLKLKNDVFESTNSVHIRGKVIDLDDLVNTKLTDKFYLESLKNELNSATPYPHIVVEDWFNPTLLELVHEEFDQNEKIKWRNLASKTENTHRSLPVPALGPASTLYFNLVNSGWFSAMLSQMTGTEDLIPDSQLYSGGLHETKKGGGFAVHADFNCHIRTGLRNEMVFITYLNKNWEPSWSGALELWDSKAEACVKKVEPEFGRSLLMLNGANNFHGHPNPLNPPNDRTRRSVAAYFYSNPLAKEMREQRVTTTFLAPESSSLPVTGSIRVKEILRQWIPPIIWSKVKKATGNER